MLNKLEMTPIKDNLGLIAGYDIHINDINPVHLRVMDVYNKVNKPEIESDDADDCLVKALAIALRKSYDETYDLVYRTARKLGLSTMNAYVLDKLLKENGYNYSFGNTYNKSLLDFFKIADVIHSTSTYVVACNGHVFTIENGIIYEKLNYSEEDDYAVTLSYYLNPLTRVLKVYEK